MHRPNRAKPCLISSGREGVCEAAVCVCRQRGISVKALYRDSEFTVTFGIGWFVELLMACPVISTGWA